MDTPLPTTYQVDALRVESVVRGYAANAAEILPLQHPARTLLPPLLFCMACEVLHVRLLAPEVWYGVHLLLFEHWGGMATIAPNRVVM